MNPEIFGIEEKEARQVYEEVQRLVRQLGHTYVLEANGMRDRGMDDRAIHIALAFAMANAIAVSIELAPDQVRPLFIVSLLEEMGIPFTLHEHPRPKGQA
jgi:hypothetical protein